MSYSNSFRRGPSAPKTSSPGRAHKTISYKEWTPPYATKLKGQLPVQPGVDPIDQIAEPVLLVPGKYNASSGPPSDVYTLLRHRYTTMDRNSRQRFHKMPCIRGEEYSPKACVGCMKVETMEWGKDGDSRQDTLINALHLSMYHGQTHESMNPAPGGTNVLWKECYSYSLGMKLWSQRKGVPCKGCQGGHQNRLGGHRYLQLGFGNMKSLSNFQEDVLSKVCKKCKTGAVEIGLACSECNALVYDFANGTYTADQIEEIKNSSELLCSNTLCRRSQAPNFCSLDPQYKCGYNLDLTGAHPTQQGCSDGAEVYNIYDVVMWLVRKGEGSDTRIHVQKWVPKERFPWPGTSEEVDLVASGVLNSVIPEVFDFEKIFNITTAQQAELLGIRDPYDSRITNATHTSYPQQGHRSAYVPGGEGGAPAHPYPPQGSHSVSTVPAPPSPSADSPQSSLPLPPPPKDSDLPF